MFGAGSSSSKEPLCNIYLYPNEEIGSRSKEPPLIYLSGCFYEKNKANVIKKKTQRDSLLIGKSFYTDLFVAGSRRSKEPL